MKKGLFILALALFTVFSLVNITNMDVANDENPGIAPAKSEYITLDENPGIAPAKVKLNNDENPGI